MSVVQNKWYMRHQSAAVLNRALEEVDKVILLFTVKNSNVFQVGDDWKPGVVTNVE